MGSVKFKHSSAGFKQILASKPVQGVIQARCDAIARALEGTDEIQHLQRPGDPWVIVSDVQVHGRAVGIVSGVPWAIEIEHRTMLYATEIGLARFR